MLRAPTFALMAIWSGIDERARRAVLKRARRVAHWRHGLMYALMSLFHGARVARSPQRLSDRRQPN